MQDLSACHIPFRMLLVVPKIVFSASLNCFIHALPTKEYLDSGGSKIFNYDLYCLFTGKGGCSSRWPTSERAGSCHGESVQSEQDTPIHPSVVCPFKSMGGSTILVHKLP